MGPFFFFVVVAVVPSVLDITVHTPYDSQVILKVLNIDGLMLLVFFLFCGGSIPISMFLDFHED